MEDTVYRDLMRHMEWADARTWAAALGVPSLQQDPQMRDRLHHYHTTQWAYLQLWRHEEVTIAQASSFADLKALGQWVRAYYRELPSFLDTVDEAALERRITLPWAERLEARFGKITPATLAENMLQLTLHTAHHRGQAATKIREAGGAPDVIDYIAWVWFGRPAPDWASVDAG